MPTPFSTTSALPLPSLPPFLTRPSYLSPSSNLPLLSSAAHSPPHLQCHISSPRPFHRVSCITTYSNMPLLSGQHQRGSLIPTTSGRIEFKDVISLISTPLRTTPCSCHPSQLTFFTTCLCYQVSTSGSLIPTTFSGRIEFRDVIFRYPARPEQPVLRGLSLLVNPGQCCFFHGIWLN